jgi:hypothetical protein
VEWITVASPPPKAITRPGEPAVAWEQAFNILKILYELRKPQLMLLYATVNEHCTLK